MHTTPAVTSTRTRAPISRQGTLWWLVSRSTEPPALHTPDHLAHLPERRPAHERRQCLRLIPPEPLDRRLAGGAMDALIGNLAHPSDKVRFQRRPRGEPVAGDRVLLHVADAVLVLALGPGPIRRTGARPESPVAGEGVQPLVEHDLARQRIVANDQ